MVYGISNRPQHIMLPIWASSFWVQVLPDCILVFSVEGPGMGVLGVRSYGLGIRV